MSSADTDTDKLIKLRRHNMLEGVTLEMKPTEETPACINIGGFGGDRRITLRFSVTLVCVVAPVRSPR